MKKVIELIRVSTEQQAASDRASIPAQRTVNRKTCHQFGLEIVKSIEFADVSGASVLLTPELQEVIRLIRSPEIDGVVAREFSRLMRPDNFDDYTLLQAFADSQTLLYLPESPIDFNNKMGRVMGAMRAVMAGLERTEILERVFAAKEEKRRRGELAQSKIVLPFGVDYEQSRGFYYKPDAQLVRHAFKDFLAGNHSYVQLAKPLGLTPRGMHLVLRNPIWTGWRVIKQKRDSTAAGKYVGKAGRQSDRRKVNRKPEEIIRVRVIEDPLIPEEEFEAAQRIMDRKQSKHWRSREGYEHRFTYNGFLTCANCGEVVHTCLARRDYYACKARRVDHVCSSRYMGRQKLEAQLDELFADKLTDPAFLRGCVEELVQRSESDSSAAEVARLEAQISELDRKRKRVLDMFVEGIIQQPDRDERLAVISGQLQAAQSAVQGHQGAPVLSVEGLVATFAPLAEWDFWNREQKRQMLSTLMPDIRVSNYKVESLGLNPALFSNEDTLPDMTSSRFRFAG